MSRNINMWISLGVGFQGRIQDFVLGGRKSARGLGTAYGLQWVQGRALVGGHTPPPPTPRNLLGFEYLGSFSVNNFEAFCECDEVY